ncbi:hypothetical protein Tco_1070111 [Tanacetum coccineum]|uniref:Uncharacterized protein n=1 Tax=Tanacetum coccineum TaxID=301880 RepID=A0ABQ5HLV1_9ASTR
MSSPTPRRYRWEIVYLTGLAELGHDVTSVSCVLSLRCVVLENRVIFGSIPIGACEVEISSWRGARVDVRTYLLGGAIDGSEANGIIRDPKLELESSRFTFDLVPLSYESVDVVVGENWLLRHKAEMELQEGSCRLMSLERQEVWNDCMSCKVRVGSNGNLLWEVSVLLGRKKGGRMRNGHVEVYGYAFWVNQCTSGFHGVNEPGGVRVAREDDRGVSEGREDVREVFQQRGSGAKRKLSRCGRNQMGNEPILALPEGADNFVVYYGSEKPMIEACWKEGEGFFLIMLRIKVNATGELTYREFDFEAKYHLGKANVDVVPWSADLHLGDDRDLGYEEALRQSSIHLGAVTVLWAVTGESELNGSNLVTQKTTQPSSGITGKA